MLRHHALSLQYCFGEQTAPLGCGIRELKNIVRKTILTKLTQTLLDKVMLSIVVMKIILASSYRIRIVNCFLSSTWLKRNNVKGTPDARCESDVAVVLRRSP